MGAFDPSVFRAHTEALSLRAADAWDDSLDDAQRAALQAAGIDRNRWAITFAHRLLTADVGSKDAPTTEGEAWRRRVEMLDDVVARLATSEARRLTGLDPPSLLTVDRATSGLLAADRLGPTLEEPAPLATPFDGIIELFSIHGDRIRIGPFRLLGALELLAAVVSAILLLLPWALAATWRLVVLREFRVAILGKALVGWAVIALIATYLIAPKA